MVKVPFNQNIPQSTDFLSNSQADLLNNNRFLQTWSVTDHYGLDDNTSNNGKHQVLQMPVQAVQPVTTIDPMFYSFAQATGNAGTLQYMCQAGGVVQSPITPIQSSAAGISLAPAGTATIFDFSGSPSNFPYCYGYVNGFGISDQAGNPIVPFNGFFYWNGSKGVINGQSSVGLKIQFSGNILQLTPSALGINYSQISWTLVFNRTFTPT